MTARFTVPTGPGLGVDLDREAPRPLPRRLTERALERGGDVEQRVVGPRPADELHAEWLGSARSSGSTSAGWPVRLAM